MVMILAIVPVGTIRGSVLNTLKYEIPEYLPYEKVVREQKINLPDSYDPVRKQYNAAFFFSEATSGDYDSLLLVTDTDMYLGLLNYVFGHYEGNTALVSMQRIDPSWDQRDNPQTFRDRLLNESLHQLGHTFGLTHCKKKCVMKHVSDVLDIDRRPIDFCKPCSSTVEKHFKK